MESLPEIAGKMGRTDETAHLGDFRYGEVCLDQQSAALLKPQLFDIAVRREPGRLLELPHEMIFADRCDMGELVDVDLGVVVSLDIVAGFCDTAGIDQRFSPVVGPRPAEYMGDKHG